MELGNKNYVLAGLSFLHGQTSTHRMLEFDQDVTYHALLDSTLREWTLFGEGTFTISDRLKATIGGRLSTIAYSGRKQDMIAGLQHDPIQTFATRTQTIAAPSAALLFDVSPTVRAFLRLQQGYRPGGVALDFGEAFRFNADRITTAEFGMRFGRSHSGPISGNLSLSHSRWTDIQADVADAIGLPITINIGEGEISTAQATLQVRPASTLTLDVSALYNRSRLTEPSLRLLAFDTGREVATGGSTLPNVADFNARIAARYSGSINAEWNWDIVGALRYVGKSRLGLGDRFDKMQGGYTQSNLLVRFSRDDLSIFLSGANLFNDTSSRFGVGNPFAPDIAGQFVPQRPRSATIGLDWSF
jgi:outer membrane receptor protein involved in Fe transport